MQVQLNMFTSMDDVVVRKDVPSTTVERSCDIQDRAKTHVGVFPEQNPATMQLDADSIAEARPWPQSQQVPRPRIDLDANVAADRDIWRDIQLQDCPPQHRDVLRPTECVLSSHGRAIRLNPPRGSDRNRLPVHGSSPKSEYVLKCCDPS